MYGKIIGGGVIGAGSGAALDSDNRLRGAALGGLLGAGVGAGAAKLTKGAPPISAKSISSAPSSPKLQSNIGPAKGGPSAPTMPSGPTPPPPIAPNRTALPGQTAAPKAPKTPNTSNISAEDMQSFNVAKSQGYTGTADDWVKQMKADDAFRASEAAAAAEANIVKGLSHLDPKVVQGLDKKGINRLMMQYHPDRYTGDLPKETIQEISDALMGLRKTEALHGRYGFRKAASYEFDALANFFTNTFFI